MVDPVTLWPVRSVPKSVTDEGAHNARAPALSMQPHGSATSLPKLVSMAADLAKGGPPLDYAKVTQLRQALARGQYAMDVHAIADAMVGFFRTGE